MHAVIYEHLLQGLPIFLDIIELPPRLEKGWVWRIFWHEICFNEPYEDAEPSEINVSEIR